MKPAKTKSLGQIAYHAWLGRGAKWRTNAAWERIARAVESEVLRRIRKKYPLIEYP